MRKGIGVLLFAAIALFVTCAPALEDVRMGDGTLSFSLAIGPDLPAMTLTLQKAGEEAGEFGAVYRYAATLAEKDEPARVAQRFEVLSEQALGPDFFIDSVDLNFDGYLDLDITYTLTATNAVRRFFLWDVAARGYAETRLDALEVTTYYMPYPETGLIESYTHDSAATGVGRLSRWADGRLTPVRVVDSTAPADDGAIRLTVTDYASGAPVVTRDEQIRLDRFVEMLQAGDVDALLWEGI